MIKTEGKVYDAVVEKLNAMGLNTKGIAVATLPRSGPDHLIVRKNETDGELETIGEYNHTAKSLLLYPPEPPRNH